MKIVHRATLLIIAAAIMSAGCRAIVPTKTANIPATVTAQLDSQYPHWRLHLVDPGAQEFVKKNSLSDNPAVARGDFNGDGLEDVGLLIDHDTHCQLIIAHKLQGAGGYQLFSFEENRADYLLVSRKGKGGYDHNTKKGFVFPHDSVEANTFEQSARAYIFTDSKYYVAQTSD
jgi:hypothetical protein